MLDEKTLKLLKKDGLLRHTHIDFWTLNRVYTVGWYNMLRKHKLINRKLKPSEFDLLKDLSQGK